MNFQNVLEELDRLYEEMPADVTAEKPEASVEDDAVLEEAADDSEVSEETPEEISEEPAEEEAAEIDDNEEIKEAAVQLVLECTKCGAFVIKPEADVMLDEESALANMEEPCQYCEEAEGYKVIGTFVPYEEEPIEEDAVDSTEEQAEDAVVEEELAIDTEEASDEQLDEGIFDSKATKQKQYEEDIKATFGEQSGAVISNIVNNSMTVIEDVADMLGEDSAAKNLASSTIKMIDTAKATVNKTPHALVKSIRDLGQKYAPNSTGLDEVRDFITKVGKLQTNSKTGYKAMQYLFERVNKQLETRLNSTVAFLKKEFGII